MATVPPPSARQARTGTNAVRGQGMRGPLWGPASRMFLVRRWARFFAFMQMFLVGDPAFNAAVHVVFRKTQDHPYRQTEGNLMRDPLITNKPCWSAVAPGEEQRCRAQFSSCREEAGRPF